jgi:hypothetical protein
MLVFKENVYGFVYDSQYGNVVEVFNEPLTERDIFLCNSILGEDSCLFTDIDDCNEMFEILSKEDLGNDEEGLNEVFDFID